ncbi:D-aminoacyl-tRNA deacylase [Fervidicoccus fontis]|uniref:D-aminoacyl-tRNA deacylase n=2 Tax=Fervidicoccus fontis TaxID=683846 RepID=I0A216_FERFK|nr:D-aminoacyl-tRNA deacylase [Fervidicoccus fontis]AFH43023.1 hypothetical protein FFONT_1035 [Fervidicoccus fontis Kam940]MBE9391423.1 D-aminoacyl-tRNA deacylase [Fervidicoccus fontis]PMB75645.1 MAG: D-tyrosyl-tRNA(Tyr) deacylase [Fervidicoccus fontis]PMB76565.1 MAG: D-tyrosyl-tRNA(Tyr) deacylase [Fervidicoccus fontis]HEW63980.1 D-tyrosyl-tRNA(Tyr) deacylase [Fervidicoccus fontis]
MRALVTFSYQDPAGVGMAEELKKISGSEIEIKGFDVNDVEFSFLEDFKEYNAFIVLSMHMSEAGIPCLTVHHTGNLTSKALLGGRPREISVSFPRLSGFLIKKIHSLVSYYGLAEKMKVSYEATHHGPTNITRPLVYVEIGSSEKEWKDKELQKLMAEAVYDAYMLLKEDRLPDCEKAIGFGGGHYSERHTKISIENNVCFGHLVPKYAIKEGIDSFVLDQIYDKNYEGINSVYAEKKIGTREFREEIEKKAKERNVKFVYF